MGVAACGSTALDAFSVNEPAVAMVAALSSVTTRTLVNFEVILSIFLLQLCFDEGGCASILVAGVPSFVFSSP
jgi:hypothetical protein